MIAEEYEEFNIEYFMRLGSNERLSKKYPELDFSNIEERLHKFIEDNDLKVNKEWNSSPRTCGLILKMIVSPSDSHERFFGEGKAFMRGVKCF